MNIMEQRIWDYLDGTCTPQERKIIEQLIETDPVYRSMYEDIKLFNQDISHIELDEPSMGFTQNLMEKVKLEKVPGSIRSVVDKRIIYGISGFFLITIFALLGVLLAQMDWSQPVTGVLQDYKMPELNWTKYMSNTFVKSFLFLDTILGLYAIDTILRKQLLSKRG